MLHFDSQDSTSHFYVEKTTNSMGVRTFFLSFSSTIQFCCNMQCPNDMVYIIQKAK